MVRFSSTAPAKGAGGGSNEKYGLNATPELVMEGTYLLSLTKSEPANYTKGGEFGPQWKRAHILTIVGTTLITRAFLTEPKPKEGQTISDSDVEINPNWHVYNFIDGLLGDEDWDQLAGMEYDDIFNYLAGRQIVCTLTHSSNGLYVNPNNKWKKPRAVKQTMNAYLIGQLTEAGHDPMQMFAPQREGNGQGNGQTANPNETVFRGGQPAQTSAAAPAAAPASAPPAPAPAAPAQTPATPAGMDPETAALFARFVASQNATSAPSTTSAPSSSPAPAQPAAPARPNVEAADEDPF